MSVHPILVGVNGHGGHGQLVGGSENPNGDFTSVGDEHLFERTRMTSLLLSQAGDATERCEQTFLRAVVCEDSRLGTAGVSGWCTRSRRVDTKVGHPGFDLLMGMDVRVSVG